MRNGYLTSSRNPWYDRSLSALKWADFYATLVPTGLTLRDSNTPAASTIARITGITMYYQRAVAATTLANTIILWYIFDGVTEYLVDYYRIRDNTTNVPINIHWDWDVRLTESETLRLYTNVTDTGGSAEFGAYYRGNIYTA